MQLEQCKLCETELEDMEYGHPIPNNKSPYNLQICYGCLKELKKELSQLK